MMGGGEGSARDGGGSAPWILGTGGPVAIGSRPSSGLRGVAGRRDGTSLADYRRGQERLYGEVVATCEADAGFVANVEGALSVALSLLGSDPELTYLLTAWPDRADAQVRRCRSEWNERYGGLLRKAAVRGGVQLPPFFVEPALIDGIGFLAAEHARSGGARRLERLLPTMRWYLLSYYLSPAEIARSCRLS